MELNDVEKVVDALGSNLVTLAEYYMGDKAYILIVCHNVDFETLSKLKELGEVPTVFSLDEIANARDVFPIEFLNISKHHKIINGDHILKDIIVTKEDLRRQLEFEFRSKLIHLRRAYLKADDSNVDDIILDAVPTMAPIIGGLMYLKNIEGKFGVDKFKEAYGIDTQILLDIYHIRKGNGKLEENRDEYIRKLIDILTEIGRIINDMEISTRELTKVGDEAIVSDVKDVIGAKDVARDYLAKQGIIIFVYEIVSIFKRGSAWFVTIEGKTFTGVVIIKTKTGEILATVKL